MAKVGIMLNIDEAHAIVRTAPGWGNIKDITLRPLVGGLTNQSFVVETNGESFVLRISGPNSVELSIDRQREFEAMTTVAEAGFAPGIVHSFIPSGHLLRRFVPGEVWGWGDMNRPEIVSRATQSLRAIHRLGPITAEFSPFADIDARLTAAKNLGVALPDDIAHHIEQAASIQQRFWCRPLLDRGLCHNDAYAGNYVATEDRILMIDWEFAGMGDVYYDLAALGLPCSTEQKAAMLLEYWGELPPQAMLKLDAMQYLNRLWNWTWAIVQVQMHGGRPEHVKPAEDLLRGIRREQGRWAAETKGATEVRRDAALT